MLYLLSPWLLVLLSRRCLGQETVPWNDPQVTWGPPIAHADKVQKCLKTRDGGDSCKGIWAKATDIPQISWLPGALIGGVIVTKVSNSSTKTNVTVNFRGSQIQVWGGSGPNNPIGVGTATVDGLSQSVNFTVYTGGLSSSLVFAKDQLEPNAQHELHIDVDSPSGTIVYIDHFVVGTTSAGPLQSSISSQLPPPLSLPSTTPSPLPDPITANSSYTTSVSLTHNGSIPVLSTTDHVSASSSSTNGTLNSNSSPSTRITLPTAAMSSSKSHSVNAAHVAGLVLGVFAAVIAVCLIIFCFIQRRRRTKIEDAPPVEVKAHATTLSLVESMAPVSHSPSAALLPFISSVQSVKSRSAPYAFSRRVSSTASSHDPPVPRIPGISPYTYQHPVPYPESSLDSASRIDAGDIAEEPPLPHLGGKVPAEKTLKVPKARREVSLSAPGRVLRVLNPDHGSNASTAGDAEK